VNRVRSRACQRGREGLGFDGFQKNPQLIDGYPSWAAASGDPRLGLSCFDGHAHENQYSAVRSPGFVSPTESTRPPSVASGHFRLEPDRNHPDLALGHASELLFVDPSISDLGMFLGNLRPRVEAIVLDRVAPPARQMVVALEGRDGLDAVAVTGRVADARRRLETKVRTGHAAAQSPLT
jgi:hypothetical protein